MEAMSLNSMNHHELPTTDAYSNISIKAEPNILEGPNLDIVKKEVCSDIENGPEESLLIEKGGKVEGVALKDYHDTKPKMEKRETDWKKKTKKKRKKSKRRKMHQCPICAYLFPYEHMLITHSLIHSEKPGKGGENRNLKNVNRTPYGEIRTPNGDIHFDASCHICLLKFTTKGHLYNSLYNSADIYYQELKWHRVKTQEKLYESDEDHVKLHGGEKPHVCEVCKAAFPLRAYRLELKYRKRVKSEKILHKKELLK